MRVSRTAKNAYVPTWRNRKVCRIFSKYCRLSDTCRLRQRSQNSALLPMATAGWRQRQLRRKGDEEKRGEGKEMCLHAAAALGLAALVGLALTIAFLAVDNDCRSTDCFPDSTPDTLSLARAAELPSLLVRTLTGAPPTPDWNGTGEAPLALTQRIEAADSAATATLSTDTDVGAPGNGSLSVMAYVWARFVGHDMLDALRTGNSTLLQRLPEAADAVAWGEGVVPLANGRTPWLDGEQLYNLANLTHLRQIQRTGSGGLLRTAAVDIPLVGLVERLAEPADERSGLGAGADGVTQGGPAPVADAGNLLVRAMYAAWTNEHNYWAAALATALPWPTGSPEREAYTDEALFWAARTMVVAEMQAITYLEWLPVVLGPELAPTRHELSQVATATPNGGAYASAEWLLAAHQWLDTALPAAGVYSPTLNMTFPWVPTLWGGDAALAALDAAGSPIDPLHALLEGAAATAMRGFPLDAAVPSGPLSYALTRPGLAADAGVPSAGTLEPDPYAGLETALLANGTAWLGWHALAAAANVTGSAYSAVAGQLARAEWLRLARTDGRFWLRPNATHTLLPRHWQQTVTETGLWDVMQRTTSSLLAWPATKRNLFEVAPL